MKKVYTIDDDNNNITVREYLSKLQLSTTQIKRYKFDGNIEVNGQTVTVRHVLHANDTLVLTSNERLITPNKSTNLAEIVYRDQYLYVANKPYDVPTHPDRKYQTDTLGNRLATTFGNDFKLRIITRLDKTTSGLVLGALDEITAEKLNALQLNHGISKTYVALVHGSLPHEQGVITLPLLRLDGQNKTVVDDHGKNAETSYEVLQTNGNTTLVKLTPLTGRTHQLRAHLSAIGNPIVGDTLYGGKQHLQLMLRCYRLQFVHPVTKQNVDVTIPHEFTLL